MNVAPIRSIVIAGGGTAGWMAAAALAQFVGVPGADVTITLVESDTIGTIGVGEATIPQVQLFNAGLGIDERDFLRETMGTIKLGIEFDGWRCPGEKYMHAFGVVGRGAGLVPFRDYWARARAEGLRALPYGDYSLNEVAAYAGRMGRGDGRPGPLPDLVAAYHFDAGLYGSLLRRYAETRGVFRVEGRIASVERDGESGNVAALAIEGDRRVAGELFIDCTGFRSLLLGDATGEGWVDWSNQLPCDRAFAVPCARGIAFRPYTQSIARAAGWQWRVPLQHRTGNGHVYCSSFLGDDEAAATLLANLDGEAQGEPRQLRFRAGHRAKYGAGNVVALGLAAGCMEPLESTSIHLVQSGIARLLTLFPGAGAWDALRAEFNRQSNFEWERIRDVLLLHYKANERYGEPFWDMVRATPFTDTLAAKVELFRSSGRITREGEELFTEEGWAQVMIGQGFGAERWHPLADAVPSGELQKYLVDMQGAIKRKVAAMPLHDEFLSDYLAA
ncbi:MAG: tryptophan 7-halogenase [Sphingomicrobium sp.]